MNEEETLSKIEDFIKKNYRADLEEALRKDKSSLEISFSLLEEFSPDLSDLLLDNPEHFFYLASKAIEETNLGFEDKKIEVRIINLPDIQSIGIRNIRGKHLNKLVVINGLIRQTSDVRPVSSSIVFECLACSEKQEIEQEGFLIKKPERCVCGKKGRFRILDEKLVDTQRISVEETPETLEGGEQPKRINVFLKKDLVDPTLQRNISPGSKVKVIGLPKKLPILSKIGSRTTRFDLILEANNIIPIEREFGEVEITKEDIQEIKKLAKDPNIFTKLKNSIAPAIYGYDMVKESLAHQLFGGIRKVRPDGTTVRGDIHILLIGDPGTAKTQLLRSIGQIAPKSRYVTGRGTTTAGLCASVVRDEFLRGWALEAGALVLANKGFALVDEIDKMSKEDSVAMHEALETQSYHPETEILFSNGITKSIKEITDELFVKNKKKIIKGVDCEILPIKQLELLTTDFKKINFIFPKYISRHVSPKELIKIEFENGRVIKITPEHPVWVFEDAEFKVKPAIMLTGNELIPVPKKLIKKECEINLLKPTYKGRKNLSLPVKLTVNLSLLLGFIASEGHSYGSTKNRYAEIGVSNTNLKIVSKVERLFKEVFKTKINVNKQPFNSRYKATKDLYTIRCCSKEVYSFFKLNFPELIFKARFKRVPNKIKSSCKEMIISFLKSYFLGDGFIDSTGFGFSTSSYNMAKDCQDLLLFFGIWNHIRKENRQGMEYYKIVVSGETSKKEFINLFVDKNDKRYEKINFFYNRSKNKLNARDPISTEVIVKIKKLLKEYKLDTGYFFNIIKKSQNTHRNILLKELLRIDLRISKILTAIKQKDFRKSRRLACIEIKDLSKELEVSHSTIQNLERRKDNNYFKKLKELILTKILDSKRKISELKGFLKSDVRLIKIKNIKKIKSNCKFVYDMTVEPTRTFISEGLILHNTVTIAKANIYASLRAETSVLAAANPKFSRFNKNVIPAEQIELAPTLLSRFDLILPMRDIPNKEEDKKVAHKILQTHTEPEALTPEINTKLLRKYIAYSKMHCFPQITKEAEDEIKKFYVNLRNKKETSGEDLGPIPISPRQLESVIRLSEASAKIKLQNKVKVEDAKRAINLMNYYLREVGMEPETGEIDIDRIVSDISTVQRNRIFVINDIIKKLEKEKGENIPTEDLIAKAVENGMEEGKVKDILDKMKREGEIFEPKQGMVRRLR